MKNLPAIVLASASPRRKELLALLGVEFSIDPSGAAEDNDSALSPVENCRKHAVNKAKEVFSRHPDCLVIGSDTIATIDQDVIGKPKDRDDAKRILRRLSGTSHEIVTAVCMISQNEYRLEHEISAVIMRPLEDREIDEYVASGEADDKAGAYAIQEKGDKFVVRYEGSYSNIVGLPVNLTSRMLLSIGYDVPLFGVDDRIINQGSSDNEIKKH
ncbi:MAG: Maf family protein [Planctomycetes bacterium]|nr:Maf family protein [Planctomycetota bacterium]